MIKRYNRLPQLLVHFVIDRANLFTDHRTSGRPIRCQVQAFQNNLRAYFWQFSYRFQLFFFEIERNPELVVETVVPDFLMSSQLVMRLCLMGSRSAPRHQQNCNAQHLYPALDLGADHWGLFRGRHATQGADTFDEEVRSRFLGIEGASAMRVLEICRDETRWLALSRDLASLRMYSHHHSHEHTLSISKQTQAAIHYKQMSLSRIAPNYKMIFFRSRPYGSFSLFLWRKMRSHERTKQKNIPDPEDYKVRQGNHR